MGGDREGGSPAVPADFLPDEEEEESEVAGDLTQEVHLDELLELVEPQDVPRPVFSSAPGEESTVKLPTVRRRRSPRVGRWTWVLLGAVLLAVSAASWWLWPAPSGTLTVTSDRRSEVYVDDRRMGLAPIHQLAIEAGKHTIEVRRPGSNRTKTYRRVIREDELTEIKVRWRRPAAKKKHHRQRKHRPGRRGRKSRRR